MESARWRDEVLGGTSDLARGGRLPAIAGTVSTAFRSDGATSRMAHLPIGSKPNHKVELRARFLLFGVRKAQGAWVWWAWVRAFAHQGSVPRVRPSHFIIEGNVRPLASIVWLTTRNDAQTREVSEGGRGDASEYVCVLAYSVVGLPSGRRAATICWRLPSPVKGVVPMVATNLTIGMRDGGSHNFATTFAIVCVAGRGRAHVPRAHQLFPNYVNLPRCLSVLPPNRVWAFQPSMAADLVILLQNQARGFPPRLW